MKLPRKTKDESQDPEWHLRDPRTRKWLVQCVGCQRVGYKHDAPDKFFGRYHLVKYFEPLLLNEDGLCSECEDKVPDSTDSTRKLPQRKIHSRPHILFVCGRNKWRSPTAERLYRNDHRVEVRSAGVSTHARHQVSRADIEWADLIMVMERRYASRMLGNYRDLIFPPIVSLEIPDDYEYMDEELSEMITRSVEYHIARLLGADVEVNR